MKKINLTISIVILGLTMAFVACNKSQMIAGQGSKFDPKIQSSSELSNLHINSSSNASNMLSFSSKEELDKFYNNPTFLKQKKSESDYTPLRKSVNRLRLLKVQNSSSYLKNPAIADTLYSDYGPLLDVLNKQKLVHLFDYIVRVDLSNKTVYAIPDSISNAVGIIVHDVTNSSVLTFSTNDEVVTELVSNGQIMPLCSEPMAIMSRETKYGYCNSRTRTKKKVTYQKAGIYFSLLAKGKAQKRTLGIWWATGSPTPYMVNADIYFKPRCGGAFSWMGDPANYPVPNIYEINGGKVKFRPYGNSTALTEYDFYVEVGGCELTPLQISSD